MSVGGSASRVTRLTVVCLLATTGFTWQAGEDGCAGPGEDHQPVPWAQELLAPERTWPLSRGAGVTVGVLSTGVDAGHPQLAGRVARGFDAVAGRGPADQDCAGTGTQIAGLIAAAPAAGVGFAGLAPEATILPVRVVPGEGARVEPAEPAVLAAAIEWASGNGADVIVVAETVYIDHPDLAAAAATAVAAGITVVAAAGTAGEADESGQADPAAASPAADPPAYPAAYPGVLGVGAIDPQARAWSGNGGSVELVAPGVDLVSLQRGGGLAVGVTGNGPASGLVAGAAALVHARWEQLAPEEAARRLVATAAAAPAGPQYGAGILHPHQAVTSTWYEAASPLPLPALERPAPAPAGAGTARVALAGAGVALLLAAGGVALARTVPRGRRRRWRAGMAPSLPAEESTAPGPPVMLFDPPPAGRRAP